MPYKLLKAIVKLPFLVEEKRFTALNKLSNITLKMVKDTKRTKKPKPAVSSPSDSEHCVENSDILIVEPESSVPIVEPDSSVISTKTKENTDSLWGGSPLNLDETALRALEASVLEKEVCESEPKVDMHDEKTTHSPPPSQENIPHSACPRPSATLDFLSNVTSHMCKEKARRFCEGLVEFILKFNKCNP